MPFAIDQEALDSPNLKILDIAKPPMRPIPHAEFPRAVYLHPVDKTKEHRVLIVPDAEALKNAQKQGYKLKPHVPVPPPDPQIAAGEFEVN